MLIKREYEHKLYLEGVLMENWMSFSVTSALNVGASASIQMMDFGAIRSRIIPGTKVHFFIKNTNFPWVKGVPAGDFFLCFEGVVSGISFTSTRNQALMLACEGLSYFSKISNFFYVFDFDYMKAKNKETPLVNRDLFSPSSINSQHSQASFSALLDSLSVESTGRTDNLRPDYESVAQAAQIYNSRGELFFKRIFDIKDFDIKNVQPAVDTIENKDNSVYRTGKLELGKAFSYFMYRFSEAEGTLNFFAPQRRVINSSNIPNNLYVTAGESEDVLPYSSAVLNNDWFQIGLAQAIHSLPSMQGSNFDVLSLFLGIFDYSFIENIFPSKTKEGINEFFFKPNIFVTIPPWCNILFEGDVSSSYGGRNIGHEPTEAMFITHPWVNPADFAITTQALVDTDAQRAEQRRLLGEIQRLTGQGNTEPWALKLEQYSAGMTRREALYEDLYARIPYFEQSDAFFSLYKANARSAEALVMSSPQDGVEDKSQRKEYFEFIKTKSQINFWNAYYSHRNFSANLNFSPFLIIGHPCVIFDDFYATVGDIVSISHNFQRSGGSGTQIQLNRPRWVDFYGPSDLDVADDDFKFHTPQYQSHKVKDVYRDYYDSDVFLEVETEMNSMQLAAQIDEKIKAMAQETIALNKQEYYNKYVSELDKKRGRSFVSESVYFSSILDEAKAEEGIKKGYFEAVPSSEVNHGTPFALERQRVIAFWKDTLKDSSYLKKPE